MMFTSVDRPRVSWVVIAACLTISIAAAGMQAQAPSQATESVFVRAQRMVTAGQDSAGRAVVDSVLRATAEGTPRYAEALFWRATFSRTAAAAERDYKRIAVEYPLSPRAQESLFRLAQLETTRGDRASARAHLTRIQREHPSGSMSTRANVMLALLSFGDGDTATGCAAVATARENLTAADVELRNQLDYYQPRCANRTLAGAAGDTATAPRNAGPTQARQEYSIQVAAYDTREAADALAKRLSLRGYNVRVIGTSKPFRVRVGRYPTRDRAAEVVREMAQVKVQGVIVQAERP
jgi:cell division septation protein DedD